jgi:uncharacterized SAM-binding protein YcdF (DUF218 family)
MLFWLKKFIAFWLMPLPLCAALIAAGWWLARRPDRVRCGRRLTAAGIGLLFLLSNNAVSFWLLRPLENRYPPIGEFRPGLPPPPQLAACRFVVVLGGGHADLGALPASSKLSTSALSRLAEGVRLCRELPSARLIVSGPAVGGNPSHASVLAQAAASLGVEPARILLVDTARDTEDEARAVRRIAGDAAVALVTSAWHMPRAVGDFRAAGVDVVPCPADFGARIPDDFGWRDIGWDVESLGRSTEAVHERIGQAWMLLHGKPVKSPSAVTNP